MGKLTYIIICAIICIIASGCSDREAVERLNRAEQVMEEHPDSALLLIQGVDPSRLRTEKDRALYALLRTQALVKNDSVIASDSLIRTAVDYYTRHPRATYLMKSAFYLGEVQRNLGNLTSAVKSATQAYDLACQADDAYWIAKSAEQLMFIYNASLSEVEALKYARIAAYNYDKSGHYLNHLYSLCDICIDEENIGLYGVALERIDSILNILPVGVYEQLIGYCHSIRFPLCINLGKLDDAYKSLEELKKRSSICPLSPRFIVSEAELYRKSGKLKRAELLLDSANLIISSVKDKACIYDEYCNFYKEIGKLDKALIYKDSLMSLQSKEVRRLLNADIVVSQREFYKDKSERNVNELNKSRKHGIMILISASLLVVILVIISYVIWKKKNERIKRNIEEIQILMEQISGMYDENQILKNTLSSQNERLSIFRQDLINLFQDQPKILNKLCDQYFDKSNTNAERLMIVDRIEKHIEKFKS
ncbi:MAG: hypothetical protein K2M93_08350, partial [Muribaculaceae bacterium]|nr:hypothetical protein [Muribaculaceae bacterium]